jgi:polysaccharide export outer membrane protein
MILVVILASCMTTRKLNYLQPSSQIHFSYSDSLPYQDYKLKIDDKIFIRLITPNEKLSKAFNGSDAMGSQMMSMMGGNSGGSSDLYTYTINEKGNVTLPIVGDVKITSLTLREAKFAIEKALKTESEYLSVNLYLTNRSFSIIGAGTASRISFSKDKINIFEAVAMMGDFAYYADRSKIKILRELPNGETITKTFDVRGEDILHSEFYYIEPNDVIFVQPLNEQFFGINSFWSAVSFVTSTFSFGVFLYSTFIP